MKRGIEMSDGVVVILGTLAIFGVVAVSVVALVYNRSFSLKATPRSMEVETKPDELPAPGETQAIEVRRKTHF